MTADLIAPIDQMRTEWAWRSRSSASRSAFVELCAREPGLRFAGVHDLGDLVSQLRNPRGDEARLQAAMAVQLMLRATRPSSADPLAREVARAILQAMLPGLVNVAKRLRWGRGGEWTSGGAFFADVLATAWEVVDSWAGQDRPYAASDILSATRCRLRRQIDRHRADTEGATPLAHPDAAGRCYSNQSDLEVLASALIDLEESGLERNDAAIGYAHFVLGLSIAELARVTGHTRRHLSHRRRHVEHVLSRG